MKSSEIPLQIPMEDYDYPLPDERIARFPAPTRQESRLLVFDRGQISQHRFDSLGRVLPAGTLLVFNNTRVVRARIVMHKPSGARIELLCLEPHTPSDYERAFAATGSCRWVCMAGNLRKWKQGALEIPFTYNGEQHVLQAGRTDCHTQGAGQIVVEFTWQAPLTFGQLLELLGRVPIPPYLNRDSQSIDQTRYQTVYARIEGSVAAPTAGLHFTPELIDSLRQGGTDTEEVTLHVGAGTFLPVKDENAARHCMHAEHFEASVEALEHLVRKAGCVTAVGTTSVRTLESLAVLGWRVRSGCVNPLADEVGQWEPYGIPQEYTGVMALQDLASYARSRGLSSVKASTRIMITPAGYRFRIVNNIITNFHQPRSTLLLLIAAFVGKQWRSIYDYALQNGFRFLSYGDSSLLLGGKE